MRPANFLTNSEFILQVILPFIFFLVGCSNRDETNVTDKPNKNSNSRNILNQANDNSSTSLLYRINDKLPSLYMTEQEFRNLPGVETNPGNVKLSLQFCLSTDAPNSFTLVVWPFRTEQYDQARRIILKVADGYPTYTLKSSDLNILGGQKLSKKSVKAIFDQLNIPNNNNSETVCFVPNRSVNGSIYYTIYIFPFLPTAQTFNKDSLPHFTFAPEDFTTKPSPPASDKPDINE